MITKRFFDYHPCGVPVYAYDITSGGSVTATVIEHGATLQRLLVKDKFGNYRDVIGGFDRIIDYLDSSEYQGGTIGRVCNRLKNAEYIIDDVKYSTYANEGKNVCHAGRFGFDKKIWSANFTEDSNEVTFTYLSPDGEEGFPGNLSVCVTFTVTDDSLTINYKATTDKKTIINLTNHSYFNMNGFDSGNMEKHKIRVAASTYNETDSELIPTGNFSKVEGTAFDMRKECTIKDVLYGDHPKIRELGGLDTNFIFDAYDGNINHVADFTGDISGIKMSVYTDQSGVLIYTSNSIKATEPKMKNGTVQEKHFGACFETAAMPDAINHENFDNTILDVGEEYSATTSFKFSIAE